MFQRGSNHQPDLQMGHSSLLTLGSQLNSIFCWSWSAASPHFFRFAKPWGVMTICACQLSPVTSGWEPPSIAQHSKSMGISMGTWSMGHLNSLKWEKKHQTQWGIFHQAMFEFSRGCAMVKKPTVGFIDSEIPSMCQPLVPGHHIKIAAKYHLFPQIWYSDSEVKLHTQTCLDPSRKKSVLKPLDLMGCFPPPNIKHSHSMVPHMRKSPTKPLSHGFLGVLNRNGWRDCVAYSRELLPLDHKIYTFVDWQPIFALNTFVIVQSQFWGWIPSHWDFPDMCLDCLMPRRRQACSALFNLASVSKDLEDSMSTSPLEGCTKVAFCRFFLRCFSNFLDFEHIFWLGFPAPNRSKITQTNDFSPPVKIEFPTGFLSAWGPQHQVWTPVFSPLQMLQSLVFSVSYG